MRRLAKALFVGLASGVGAALYVQLAVLSLVAVFSSVGIALFLGAYLLLWLTILGLIVGLPVAVLVTSRMLNARQVDYPSSWLNGEARA